MKIIKKERIILLPNKRDRVIINPPHAFLEEVRKIAVEIEMIKDTNIPFLNKFNDFSNNKVIENGQIILSQHPA